MSFDDLEHRRLMQEKYPSIKKFEVMGDDYQESHDGREERLLEYLKTHPSKKDYLANPHLILNLMDEFAAQQDFLISIGPHKAGILASQIAEWKPTVLVELGGYLGYSALLFILEMRKTLSPSGGVKPHVWSLEFEPRFAEIMREVFVLAGVEGEVTVVVGAAAESLKGLKDRGEVQGIDYYFLDHVEELYVEDFKVAMELGLLKKGARIVADNVLRPGAPKYREYVRAQGNLESKAVMGLIVPGEFEDELEVTTVL